MPPLSETPSPIKQLSCPQAIAALMKYLGMGASLSMPILMVVEKVLQVAEFSDMLLCCFPSHLASALESRMDINFEEQVRNKFLAKLAL